MRKVPFILVVFILAVICAFGTLSSAREAGEVFFAPWGKRKAEIGNVRKPEMEIVGACSFCVDSENIFILDSVRSRVLCIDSQNQVYELGVNVSGWAICADGNGGVFVQEADRITHLKKKTPGNAGAAEQNKLSGIANPNGKIPKLVEGYGNELLINKRGEVYLHTQAQTDYLIKGAANPRHSLGEGAPVLSYRIKRVIGSQVRILGLDEDGKAVVSVPLQVEGGRAGAVLFKGTDLNGNLYVELEIIRERGVDLEVHRYSPGGKRLAVFNLSNAYYSTVYKKTEIAPDGSVFQMLTTPKGVRIIHYINTNNGE